MDPISVQRIAKLHPRVRGEALLILAECEKVLGKKARVRFSHTLRTNAEQDLLYAQGRTKPGNKVTNVKGGGSFHNYGLAIDIAFIVDTDNNGTYETSSWDHTKDWDGDKKADWMEVVAIFKKFGWKWGGDWTSFIDRPHFEKTFGKTTIQLKSMPKDKHGYVIF